MISNAKHHLPEVHFFYVLSRTRLAMVGIPVTVSPLTVVAFCQWRIWANICTRTLLNSSLPTLRTIDKVPKVITCQSEYRDEDNITYHAHHQYRGNGIWHDWGWVSYKNESNEDGFVDVPAKLLCFLPDGVPGNSSCHVVCHPCEWKNEMVSKLMRKWSLVQSSKDSVNKIPFDVVPVSSLFGQCFIVPDLQEDGSVYEVFDKDVWADNMY